MFKPIDFPSKMVPCRFSLNFATFWSWTHPHIKAMGSIYELQSMTTYIAHPFLGGPNSDENPWLHTLHVNVLVFFQFGYESLVAIHP